MFGIAISSSSPAVASRCAHARSGVGVVATQNVTDPRLGPAGLDLLEQGLSAPEVIEALKRRAGTALEYRQLTVVDREGITAAFSGDRALGINSHCLGKGVVAAGNMLFSDAIPRLMVEEFQRLSESGLAVRLLAALKAAVDGGGEAGPLFSAGILVYDQVDWPIVDLRVDWMPYPVTALQELWEVWQPQMNDYVTRALDPSNAPSYGVPGDSLV